MTIILVGGGSGGHLTPLIAVAEAIKQKDNSTRVVFIGKKREDLNDVLNSKFIDKNYSISAGKFRRYNGESLLSHLLDIRTLLLNVRDVFSFLVGFVEAIRLLGNIKPNAIFLKGGFVSVPVGFAARIRRTPYITHDSDAIPGLANRLTAGKAVVNATALPANYYPYPSKKTMQVGIPLQSGFKNVTETMKKEAKRNLMIPISDSVLFSVGGGLGARRVNNALVVASSKIFKEIPNLRIIHLTGKKLFQETVDKYNESLDKQYIERVEIINFSNQLYKLSSAADVVVTRAGATNIAEFAMQAKPCIIVPNPVLTGGQQLRNASIIDDNKAGLVLHEKELEKLDQAVIKIISDKEYAKTLAKNLHKLSQQNSATKIASILIDISSDDNDKIV